MKPNRFRPSQAGYWSKCAAFQRFVANLPEQESGDAAREGTCAAWVGDEALTTEKTCFDLVGEIHKNGWLVSQNMASDVQEYVDLVRSYGGIVEAEEHVVASEKPLIEGTLDSSITTITDGILRIIDLKYGRIIIETTAAQLVCYGWGKYLKAVAAGQTITEIHLSIYQPRGMHKDGIYRTRVVTPEQLHTEFTELWNMTVEGERPDSIATPGPHCLNCDAAAGCVSLAQTAYRLVNVVQNRDHRDMTPEELSRELDFMDECKATINARFKAIESEAEARIKRESVPGWTLAPKKGNRVFTLSGTTLQLVTGIDPWENKLCTPAELERRGATKDQLQMITKQPVTSHKLTKLTQNDIASMFNATKGT